MTRTFEDSLRRYDERSAREEAAASNRVGHHPGFEWRDLRGTQPPPTSGSRVVRRGEVATGQHDALTETDLEPQRDPVRDPIRDPIRDPDPEDRPTEDLGTVPGRIDGDLGTVPGHPTPPPTAREVVAADDDDVRPLTPTRRRFGGLDLGASLAGMIAALGLTALLGGIAATVGSVGFQLDVDRDGDALTTSGFFVGMAVLLVSFLVGGWVAGRIARYDGGRNGLWAAVWFLVVGLAASAAVSVWGNDADILDRLTVPRWFTDRWTADSFANAAVASALVGIVVMLVAAFVGGRLGARYHRKVDASLVVETVIAETRHPSHDDVAIEQADRPTSVSAAVRDEPTIARSTEEPARTPIRA